MAGDDISGDKPKRQRPTTTIDVSAVDVTKPEGASQARAEAEAGAQGPPSPAGGIVPLLYGALAGAIVVVITGTGLWLLGLLPLEKADTSDLSARLAKVETAARSAAPAADAKISEDIAARLAKVESALSNASRPGSDAASNARLAALETAVKALSDSITNFNSRNDEYGAALRDIRSNVESANKAVTELRQNIDRQRDAGPDKSELGKVATRIDALETATKNIQQSAASGEDAAAQRAVKRALLATALRARMLTNTPFTAELSAVKALGDSGTSLSALEPFAAQGLPSADKLGAELVALMPRLEPRDTPTGGDSLIERLQARASHLIRIRPVGDSAGDDAATILGRAEYKARRGDIDGALADILRLPEQTRAPAKEWIARAQAWQKAIAEARDLESKALADVAQPVPRR